MSGANNDTGSRLASGRGKCGGREQGGSKIKVRHCYFKILITWICCSVGASAPEHVGAVLGARSD